MQKIYIGELEYRLHKDNSLVQDMFETLEEMREDIKKLEEHKYKHLIRFYKEPKILNFN